MAIADKRTYLKPLRGELQKLWPQNRTVNLVFHGHSVPSGYFKTPVVNTLSAYPHLTLQGLRPKFPFSVINTIVTAIGGENSEQGSRRFQKEALCHRPDVLFIDYGLNDRRIGLVKAKATWRKMIEAALKQGVKVILMTPTLDTTVSLKPGASNDLMLHARQIAALAARYSIGLADNFSASIRYCRRHGIKVKALLSQSNHPNRLGHSIAASEILKWF